MDKPLGGLSIARLAWGQEYVSIAQAKSAGISPGSVTYSLDLVFPENTLRTKAEPSIVRLNITAFPLSVIAATRDLTLSEPAALQERLT
jgi:hypothetical protein